MKKKLTLVIAAYVVLIAGLLCYAQSPRVILKNTVMPYEKDFTMPKSVKKIIFERKKINIKYNKYANVYTAKFEISKKEAANMVNQLNSDRQRYLTAVENSKNGGDEEREQLEKTTRVYNLTVFYNYKKSGNRIIQEDIWKHDKKTMIDKDSDVIGYYVTGTKLFSEDFETDEDRDVVPKNFILIYKNSDDKYYLCIKRWAYRNWDYTLREWEFKEKELKEENKQ
ncbi:hypothetical protein [Lachnospira hominis (ex Liu et al. 2021)]|jgi:hypothetical protein|uniref:Uncharacterized protein n=1 Tax=Lachnospira hominis (ex Liu et al. 2021) TaxID=2763051 RepID=A0ABR7G0M8_9FIRM|nr:hypothetical protein [Lachnospira hominis]MBC5680296.1 hypothetical protein [Lachnospira hominis]HBO04006.1 hypothetical protein [Eubacterium sp.]